MRRRLCLGGVYWDTKSYHSHITRFNPSNPHTYVSCSRSNHLVQPVPPPLRPSVTSSLKFSNRSISVADQSLWNKLPPALRQMSDPSYEPAQTSPLKISSGSFTPN